MQPPLDPNSSSLFMDTAATYVSVEMGSAVLIVYFFTVFRHGSAFGCFFGTWGKVAQSAEEACALGSDDGDREAPAHLVQQCAAIGRVRIFSK